MNGRTLIAFEEATYTNTPGGVVTSAWTVHHRCVADLIYQRGNETVEAARLQGRAIYKVKVRQCAVVRTVTTAWRISDTRRGTIYNIREVDAITDPAFAFFVIEGKA